MKEIKEAIQESITTDSIIHITVEAADIFEAMGGVDFDDTVSLGDGHYDVWGTDDDGNDWRLNVAVI